MFLAKESNLDLRRFELKRKFNALDHSANGAHYLSMRRPGFEHRDLSACCRCTNKERVSGPGRPKCRAGAERLDSGHGLLRSLIFSKHSNVSIYFCTCFGIEGIEPKIISLWDI